MGNREIRQDHYGREVRHMPLLNITKCMIRRSLRKIRFINHGDDATDGSYEAHRKLQKFVTGSDLLGALRRSNSYCHEVLKRRFIKSWKGETRFWSGRAVLATKCNFQHSLEGRAYIQQRLWLLL